ncbi:MAG: phosphosulfolactate synthase [Halanaerobiales bacterium]
MGTLKFPLEDRREKPRSTGLTMVIDKGMGLASLADFLELNWSYVDFIKFSFGTSLIYPEKVLKEKIGLIKSYNVIPYPGGTLFEIALFQNKMEEYFNWLKELGFSALEISDGTINLPVGLRREAIRKARSAGFLVLTEVGKKDEKESLSLAETGRILEADLQAGVDYIIIEGRESGKGIFIYEIDGSINLELFRGILAMVGERREKIIWEAPLKKQQVFLIRELGNNVSLGNIPPEEVMALEALRKGLRGDTFKLSLREALL